MSFFKGIDGEPVDIGYGIIAVVHEPSVGEWRTVLQGIERAKAEQVEINHSAFIAGMLVTRWAGEVEPDAWPAAETFEDAIARTRIVESLPVSAFKLLDEAVTSAIGVDKSDSDSSGGASESPEGAPPTDQAGDTEV